MRTRIYTYLQLGKLALQIGTDTIIGKDLLSLVRDKLSKDSKEIGTDTTIGKDLLSLVRDKLSKGRVSVRDKLSKSGTECE